MEMSAVEPPPEAFNFAAHLLGANAGRPAKTAFIDDAGAVTYAELDERARRFAVAQIGGKLSYPLVRSIGRRRQRESTNKHAKYGNSH